MAVDHDFERTMYRHTQAVPEKDDLFTTFADRVLRRVDEVIDGRFCQWAPQELDRSFLRLLRPYQGKARALALGEVCERLKITPRAAKNLTQILRLDFGVQIGASRDGEAGGYYLITSEAESMESTAQLWKQAITMLRVVHRMRRGHQDIHQLLTQLSLELKATEGVPVSEPATLNELHRIAVSDFDAPFDGDPLQEPAR